MKNMNCEHGYPLLEGACSRCAWYAKTKAVGGAKQAAALAPNRTLAELRALKSMPQTGAITEAEYDERHNTILATF